MGMCDVHPWRYLGTATGRLPLFCLLNIARKIGMIAVGDLQRRL